MLSIFDSHLHVVDPRFPLVPNAGYVPAPFTCSQYLDRMRSWPLAGGAVVAGSFQGFDQTFIYEVFDQDEAARLLCGNAMDFYRLASVRPCFLSSE